MHGVLPGDVRSRRDALANRLRVRTTGDFLESRSPLERAALKGQLRRPSSAAVLTQPPGYRAPHRSAPTLPISSLTADADRVPVDDRGKPLRTSSHASLIETASRAEP